MQTFDFDLLFCYDCDMEYGYKNQRDVLKMTFPLSFAFLGWVQNKYTGGKSSLFQLLRIRNTREERGRASWDPLGQAETSRACILTFVQLHPPGTSRAGLASSCHDLSFPLHAGVILFGSVLQLVLRTQQHKQSMTQEFEKMSKVKGMKCNQSSGK